MDIRLPASIANPPGGSRTHGERGLSGLGASSPPARDHAARSAFDPTRTAARTSNRAAASPGTGPRGPARPRATDRTTPCRAGFAPREPGTGTPQSCEGPQRLQSPRVATMGIEELLSENRPAILRAAKAHGAGNVRVFGSVARGEASADSDVDLLVDLEPGRSLLDHAALVIELEALLGRKVDIAIARGLRSRIRDRVLKEAIPL